jgi:glycosyltransferase involved in cell wall biosynthesis
MTKVVINPLDNIQYMSFYIVGLQMIFGADSIRYDVGPFRDLSRKALRTRGLLFICLTNDSVYNCYIAANDFWQINEEIYSWCDVYASVNANATKTPNRDKLVSLAPSFAVRCWNTPKTLYYALKNTSSFLNSGYPIKRVKTFLGNYKRLLQRPLLEDMYSENSDKDYIFFCSTLWYNNDENKNDEGVNLRRARFIRACKGLDTIRFEGGLVSQPGRSSDDLFADCILKKPYSYKNWLDKTKRSAVVFNTPAFWNCHGWKLGEFLSLGKAIISTHLSNDLPFPLIHGESIHFVDDDIKSIKSAIEMIVNDNSYREKLEHGARQWWNTYGTPEKSIELVLSRFRK